MEPRQRRPVVNAAGLIVLRQGVSDIEVVVVHRPRYDDWSLPKGKIDEQELGPEAAVREFREETGLTAVAGRPVAVVDYPVGHTIKRVHWWVGRLVDAPAVPVADPREVDVVEWVPVSASPVRLDYDDERAVLVKALGLVPTRPFLIVRHAKALDRKNWKKSDHLRPLAARGKRQAKQLGGLLASYGVEALASSPSTRCMQTLQLATPVLPIEQIEAFSEEGALAHPRWVGESMRKLARAGTRMAVCGHRPVLEAMASAIGLPADNGTLKPAETLVVHLNETGAPVTVEHYPSRL